MLKLSEINILSTLVMRFQECYKTLVNCIYDLSNDWFNENAKYFESCSQSSKTTITMYENDREEQTFAIIGSDDDEVLRANENGECKPGTSAAWGFAPGDLTSASSLIMTNLISYIGQKAKFSSGSKEFLNVSNL